MEQQDKFYAVDLLNCIIDQGKFIRNILVHNDTAEIHHVKKYIDELTEMINRLKRRTDG